MAYDADIAKVSLLLHCDGTNGSTSFPDTGPLVLTPTNNSVTVSTTQSKFGGASASFNGTSSDLVIPTNAAFDFTGDFTIEAWVYQTTNSGDRTIFMRQEAGAGVALQLRTTSSGVPLFLTRGVGGANLAVATASSAISLNAWHHIAGVRSGTTLTIYVDGVSVATATEAALNNLTCTRTPLVGAFYDGSGSASNFWAGYIDEVRVTKGLARYTSGFTPPSAAFPDVTQGSPIIASAPSTRWRVFALAAQGGPGVGIASIEMHTSIGGANVCSGGSFSASANSGSGASFTADKAFDGNDSTYWYSFAAAPQWIEYTFATAQTIAEFAITAPPGSDVYQAPQNFELQFFDGTSWQTTIRRRYEGFAAGQKRTYSTSYPTAEKQAWRLYITAVQTENPGVQDLAMRTSAGGANVCTGGTAFASGSLNENFTGDKAFDGTSALWYSSAASPQFIGYQFASAVDIVQYLITAGGAGNEVHAPKTFKLQYEDGAGTWVDSHTVTSEPNWTASETRTFGAATVITQRPVVFICT